MKTILVPVDFSVNSENALTYACEMNRKLAAMIRIFHVYHVPLPATDIPFPLNDPQLKKSAEEATEKLTAKFRNLYPDMKFETAVSEGFAEDEITDEEKNSKCDMVIMGTKGASELAGILVGTNASAVMSKSLCPVIAVPEKARMKGLKKIVFAANYGQDDFKNVYDIIELARFFDSEVILLHVSEGKSDKTFEFAEIEGFKSQVSRESNYPHISFKLLEDSEIYHGLNNYLEEVNADLLAISMRHRSFAEKIFSRSLTKKMAYHAHLPLMVFHTEI